MRTESHPDLPREIQDRLAIDELMHLYSEMVDRRDWKLGDRLFALEATIDYSSSGGPNGAFRETLAWLDRALESWPINLHFISNLIIEFEADGDAARSQCYFQAPMGRHTPDGPQFVITNSGRYLDRLVRTVDGWRILERTCEQTLMQGELPEGYSIPD